MNKLLVGLLLISTNAFAVGDYEVAEKMLAMCKSLGNASAIGMDARKNGTERATVASKEVAERYGVEVQEAMLIGYDSTATTKDKAQIEGFSKCMDKYSKLR